MLEKRKVFRHAGKRFPAHQKSKGFFSVIKTGVLIMIEREHVISVLKEVEKAIYSENILALRELSNQTIHSASMYQDPDSIAMAVTIYALGKIFEKEQVAHFKNWKLFLEKTRMHVRKAYEAVEKNNVKSFRKEIIKMRKNIHLFGPLREYIREVFRKAYINKASRIYEHGISRAETAGLLGVTQWELAEYSVTPVITDDNLTITKPIKERFKFTEDLFKK
jgi:hypothetical protein